MRKSRIGIYGGTFSPPHLGHVRAAEVFLKAVELDKLLIIPDFLPPHKQLDGNVTAEDRLQMCKKAFEHIERAQISDMEIKRGGKSYTALTLQELSSADSELYFLCGTDMFLTLDQWYKPEIIFDLANICYVRRENAYENEELIKIKTEQYIKKFGARIIDIESNVTEISSTELRAALNKKSPAASSFLPEKVYEYILKKGIYI